jgi:tRNA A37 threonylcarbamoyladenosine modification protein TsaB
VAVPTTEALVRNLRPGWKNAVVVLDAKRGQIFTATYANVDGRRLVVEGPRLDDLRSVLARTARPVHLLGEGIPYHKEAISLEDPGVIVLRSELWQARARAVAEVGGELARRGQFTAPDELVPVYIRVPEAEEKLNQKK